MRRLFKNWSKEILQSIVIVLFMLAITLFAMQLQEKQKISYKTYKIGALTESEELKSEIYIVEEGYISRILPETTLRDLKNNLDKENISVYKKTGEQLQDSEFVGTGMKLEIGSKEYKISVIGDLTGNGKIGITDLTQLKLSSLNLLPKLVDEYKKSGDMNNSGSITITDVTRENLALVNLIDVKAPNSFVPEAKSTKDTITVRGETSDSNSGIKEYWFELNTNGWVKNRDTLNNEYVFTGLTTETKYTVRMKVVDNEGNTKITKRVEVETLNEENANISILASPTEWTNQNVLVAVNYNSNVAKETKQISVDNGTTWTAYTEPVTVNKNTVVKARVLNSNGVVLEEQTKQITNIDKLPPKDFTITVETGNNSIKVNAETDDAEATNEYGKSGIKSYKYIIINGIWNWEKETTSTTYTFEGLVQAMQYKIKVVAIDNAGNEYETEITSETTAGVSTLEVDPNGGEWEGSTLVKRFPQDAGGTKTIADPVRTGYTFSGWTLTGEGTFEEGIYTYGVADGKITAKWTPITYTINYNGNGATTGSTVSSKHTYDVSKTLTPNGYRKIYTVTYETNGGTAVDNGTVESTFTGWTSVQNGAKEYNNEQEIMNLTVTDEDTIELYAIWENAVITLPESTKTGYTLVGWYTDNTFKTKAGNAGENYTVTTDGDITLYAKFEYGIYAKLYTDGTLTLSSANDTLTTKTLSKDYGNIYYDNYSLDNPHPWSNNIQSVDILDKIQPTSTAYWFSNCKNITAINNIENLNTSAVTDMSGMFYNCSGLTNIDLSYFNTSNVYEIKYMFYNCSGLTSLDLSNFNIEKLDNFAYMFYNCSGLTSIEVPSGTTEEFCTMEYMFYGCSNLTNLDLSTMHFATDSGNTSMASMFENCTKLKNIKFKSNLSLEAWSTIYMFKNCNKLIDLDLSMFTYCDELASGMFYGCSSLTSLDLSNFKSSLSDYLDTNSMFYECSSLIDLNMSNLSNSINCRNMFYKCSQLRTLNIGNFTAKSCYDFTQMFYGCSSLTRLDLSNFVIRTTDMPGMFYGCSSLTEILVGDGWTTNGANTSNMFGGGCGVSEVTRA